MKVLFMNLQGYERNREFLPKIIQDNNIDIAAFTETHKIADLDIFQNEVNSHASRPQGFDNNHGRNSGGVFCGSNINIVNPISKYGFTKCTINGIIFVTAYFNKTGVLTNKE
jgi:hypothetical protein